ncbi:interleukin-1 receptor-associated kinase 1-binding protein 1-like [Centruroides vittatus]|uniref:interleukin-1 receptor-associated kinase 1-binding protein 1-like n=1 Tax=Centruroides vittatus TaxID=120091 RepID=UPI003510A579
MSDLDLRAKPSSITCFSLSDRTLYLSSKGTVAIPPDRARLLVNICSQKKTTDDVIKSVTKRLDYVTGILKAFGIRENDVNITRSLLFDEHYIMNAEVDAVFHNLENCQTVAIQFTQKLGKCVSVSPPEFFHSSQAFEKGKRKATLEAIKNCYDKATELTKIFGVTVAKPLEISEEHNKLLLDNIKSSDVKRETNINDSLAHKLKLLTYISESKVSVKFEIKGEYKQAIFLS